MTKIQSVYTNDTEKKRKRNKRIKSGCYALILTCSIVLGATLVAVNVGKDEKINSPAVIQTSTPEASYYCPLENCTVLKDYNDEELQYNDTLKQWEIHKAVDLTADADSKVFAIANGTVTNIYTNYLEGTVVEISHNNGLTSIYKSLNSDLKIKLGDYVKQGTAIGTVSSTMARELNSGSHLHFELLLNKIYVNPNDYIDFCKK